MAKFSGRFKEEKLLTKLSMRTSVKANGGSLCSAVTQKTSMSWKSKIASQILYQTKMSLILRIQWSLPKRHRTTEMLANRWKKRKAIDRAILLSSNLTFL